ncbi:hypothetical protein V3C99_001016, partial [Haemonchus contortus]
GYDLSIVNNTELTSIDELLFPNLLDVEISDNLLLVLDCTHIMEYYSTVRRIRGNVNDCGCELDGALTKTTVLAVEDNCELIYGDFILSGKDTPSSDILEQKFGKASMLGGQLLVMGTDIVDLSFLGKVQIIEKYLTSTEIYDEKYIRITGNEKLERLGLDMLTEVFGVTIHISGNSNLCFTPNEMSSFIDSYYIDSIEGRICEGRESTEFGLNRSCRIGINSTLATIPANCETLIGRLTIDHTTDLSQLWKLYNVTTIYGQLVIRNTSITCLAALWKLVFVVNLTANETAMVIESNERLRSPFLSSIYIVISDRPVRLQDNPVMMLSDDDCAILNKSTKVDSRGNRQNCAGLINSSSELLGVVGQVNILLVVWLVCGCPSDSVARSFMISFFLLQTGYCVIRLIL